MCVIVIIRALKDLSSGPASRRLHRMYTSGPSHTLNKSESTTLHLLPLFQYVFLAKLLGLLSFVISIVTERLKSHGTRATGRRVMMTPSLSIVTAVTHKP